jgi:single-strand DNA-binding protein
MNETWVTIVGNVADDPRHLMTNNGVLTAFRIAQTPRNQRDGMLADVRTSFYDVACFKKLADHVAGSIIKGDPVIVHGQLSMREWQKEDRRGRDAQIVASHVGHNMAYGTSSFRRPQRLEAPATAAEPIDLPVREVEPEQTAA